jgi:hypothetical protein
MLALLSVCAALSDEALVSSCLGNAICMLQPEVLPQPSIQQPWLSTTAAALQVPLDHS